MKILLSPAKLMHDQWESSVKRTPLLFESEANQTHAALNALSPDDLGKLMHLSESLSQLNWERHQQWNKRHQNHQTMPAILAYKGEVYRAIDAPSLTPKELNAFQKSTFILSGAYGLVRPLDGIAPYRLEMSTKLSVNGSKNLYDFWRPILAPYLNNHLKPNEPILNLASKEYTKAIDVERLNHPLVECVFKDYKNDELKSIMMYFKHARGLMAKHIVKNDIQTIDEVKTVVLNGYTYRAELSSESQLVFAR